MSKMITEIEKPKCCKECVWYQADPWFGGSCKVLKDEDGWNKPIEADEEYNVQKWCPLLHKKDIIPIEWIKKQIENPPYSHSWELGERWKGEYTTCLMVLLEDWEKENADVC